MQKKPTRKYSLRAEKKRLKRLVFRKCAWNRAGECCRGCRDNAEWGLRVVAASCDDWDDYENLRMSNDRAMAYLEHVKACSWCRQLRDTLQKRRERWFWLVRHKLRICLGSAPMRDSGEIASYKN